MNRLHLSCWILVGFQVRLRRGTACRRNFASRGKTNILLHSSESAEQIKCHSSHRRRKITSASLQIEMDKSAQCNLLIRVKTRGGQSIDVLANIFKRHHTERIHADRFLRQRGRKKSGRYRGRNSLTRKLRWNHDKFLESCSSEIP